MTRSQLEQYAGLALMGAGILVAVGWILGYLSGAEEPTGMAAWTLYAGHLLLFFGVIGVYGRVAESSGWIGFLGFFLAIVSNATIVGLILGAPELTLPENVIGLVGNLGMTVGTLLLVYAAWQGQAFPQWALGVLAVGSIGIGIALVLGFEAGWGPPVATLSAVLIGIAAVGLGADLWSGPAAATTPGDSAPVT